MSDWQIGERVIASANGTARPRHGVIVGKLDGEAAFYRVLGDRRYFVRFDGDDRPSGPCIVLCAEPHRKAS